MSHYSLFLSTPGGLDKTRRMRLFIRNGNQVKRQLAQPQNTLGVVVVVGCLIDKPPQSIFSESSANALSK